MMNTFLRLERSLLPPPETVIWKEGALTIKRYSLCRKVAYCVKNFFTFLALLILSPLTLAYDWLTHKKIKVVRKTPDFVPPPSWPPEQHGVATSMFQTTGMGTDFAAGPKLDGKCDWNQHMQDPANIVHPEGFDYKDFFTDILSNPAPYIKMLKAHNATAHRFSLEWSVIEPRPGEIDMKAVELYREFIQKLQKEGITPSVTLSHFVLPAWFHESGGFQKMENVDRYVQFALRAMELFPSVDHWWSFNELGVKAFQQCREVYPTNVPKGSWLPTRVHAAGIGTRNMLIAHCHLHKAVSERYPKKILGVTHQWLQFDTASGNWLERFFAYLFEKFGFTPVYQFFKDGRYSFEFPFMANIQFEIAKEEFEANSGFLRELGVQAYPKVMMKMGFNHGKTYPGGASAQHVGPFVFGASCEPGGTVMRFGPRWKAERIDEILDEAFALTPNVSITEYGSDAMVHHWEEPGFRQDDVAQGQYLQQLTERIRDYCARTGRKLGALFCWSDLRRQLEWENGHACKLGIIDPVVDKDRKMTGWTSTPASKYLTAAFDPRQQEQPILIA
ncbi:MAG: family 1 glycosylhydrolase [Chlamydiales bacterium]